MVYFGVCKIRLLIFLAACLALGVGHASADAEMITAVHIDDLDACEVKETPSAMSVTCGGMSISFYKNKCVGIGFENNANYKGDVGIKCFAFSTKRMINNVRHSAFNVESRVAPISKRKESKEEKEDALQQKLDELRQMIEDIDSEN